MKQFSQNGEDGILLKLAEYINKRNNGVYVEFGSGDGSECNTRLLRETYGWTGLLIDGFQDMNDNPEINLHNEKITHENVLSIFEKYKVVKDLDLLSIDTDYADYWILEQILTEHKPKIMVVETNPDEGCVTVPKPDKLTFWDGRTRFAGASLCAFQCLAKRFDYTIVYCEEMNYNCFWMRNDMLESYFKIKIDLVKEVLTDDVLRPERRKVFIPKTKKWYEVKC